MLLHRGHGSNLSGFLRVFSCLLLESFCSLSVLEVFDFAESSSIEGVLGFTLVSGDVSGSADSSVSCTEASSSPDVSENFPDGKSFSDFSSFSTSSTFSEEAKSSSEIGGKSPSEFRGIFLPKSLIAGSLLLFSCIFLYFPGKQTGEKTRERNLGLVDFFFFTFRIPKSNPANKSNPTLIFILVLLTQSQIP